MKMTKAEHIEYWLKNSERDWKRAEYCFEQKDYVFCLFCLHLSMEKICKALWVQNNKSNIPPKIHDLVKLLKEAKVEETEENWLFLYDYYMDKIYKIATKKSTSSIFEKCLKHKKELLSKLQ
jgi:HEPN domain-containing protein